MQAAAMQRIQMPSQIAAAGRGRAVLKDVSRQQGSCSTCQSHDRCLSAGLESASGSTFDDLGTTRKRLRKGDKLYRAGDHFFALYAIRSGSCKTVLLDERGQEQVVGYHMAGDIVGTDGIGTDHHECEVILLEDTEVCTLPFEQIARLARDDGVLQQNVHRLLSREIVRERRLMLLLGTMRAEQRLAVFLLDLSQRYLARGYSASEFVLRMTREEIGSYLGLQLETVSRLLSRFAREGLVQAEGRSIKLLDRVTLGRLLEQ